MTTTNFEVLTQGAILIRTTAIVNKKIARVMRFRYLPASSALSPPGERHLSATEAILNTSTPTIVSPPAGSSDMSDLDHILSKSQHGLRGRKISEMTVAQLKDWIDACDKAENCVGKKARRGWTTSRKSAIEELARRANR